MEFSLFYIRENYTLYYGKEVNEYDFIHNFVISVGYGGGNSADNYGSDWWRNRYRIRRCNRICVNYHVYHQDFQKEEVSSVTGALSFEILFASKTVPIMER